MARRAFGYARCSHASQAADGETLQVQAERIRALCVLHGYDLVEIFIDEGVSGSRPFRQRPAGARLWAALRRGDTCVALKLDRAFRDVRDASTTLADCREAGYGLVLADLGSEDVTRGSVSGLVFNLLASVAAFERQRAGERIRDVKTSQRGRGRFLGGVSAPFGFRVIERDGGRYVEADEELQGKVLALRAREFSGRQITAELAKVGVVASHASVLKFLKAHSMAAAA